MNRPDLPAEAKALIDQAAIDRAWAAYAAVIQQHAEARRQQQAADEALTAARLQLEGLIARAAAGKAVPEGEIEEAYRRQALCADVSAFWAVAASRADAARREASTEYEAEVTEAKLPMIGWAIQHRIAAARRLDEATAEMDRLREAYRVHPREPGASPFDDPVLVDLDAKILEARRRCEAISAEGEVAFEEAFRVLHDRNALRPMMPAWPSTEAREGAFWGLLMY